MAAPAGFGVIAGSLPPGLTLAANGQLSGTPTAGGSFSFSVQGEDANGFAASQSYTVTIIADNSAPAISYSLSPAAPDGDNGWYRSDVAVAWTVSDPESAITSQAGCDDATLASDTSGATYTCSATSAGGSESVTTATIKRDATAPVLAPSLPSPLLRGQGYVASPNASDATSGIASASCDAVDTSTLGTRTLGCTATDNAGNSTTATLAYTVGSTCANEGYTGIKLQWCQNVCENGHTGQLLDAWIHRWIDRFRQLPYCRR